jgi:hypothetical protein
MSNWVLRDYAIALVEMVAIVILVALIVRTYLG